MEGQEIRMRHLSGGSFCMVIYPIFSRYDWWRCPACRVKYVTNGELSEPLDPEPAAW
jgi:hypothetical protein